MNVLKKALGAYAVTLLLVHGYAHAQVANKPKPEDFKAGETWEFRRVDNRSKVEEPKTTTTIVQEGGSLKISANGKVDPVETFFEREGYKKPWWVWPIEVGKTWDNDGDWTNAAGDKGNTRQSARVLAYEEIEVPAGKFMAYKVEMKGFWRNNRWNNGGRQNDTFWYAPSSRTVIRWIRDDGHNSLTQELVSFKPAP
jgi:hypothetical protein